MRSLETIRHYALFVYQRALSKQKQHSKSENMMKLPVVMMMCVCSTSSLLVLLIFIVGCAQYGKRYVRECVYVYV